MTYSYDRRAAAYNFDALTEEERTMLSLLAQRKSDSVIRSTLGVSQDEGLRMANGIRKKLNLSMTVSLRDVGKQLPKRTLH